MQELFTAIETMTTGAIIIKVIEIMVVILLVCAIFEIAGNSIAIRKSIDNQNELIKKQTEELHKTNLILVKQFTKDNDTEQ